MVNAPWRFYRHVTPGRTEWGLERYDDDEGRQKVFECQWEAWRGHVDEPSPEDRAVIESSRELLYVCKHVLGLVRNAQLSDLVKAIDMLEAVITKAEDTKGIT